MSLPYVNMSEKRILMTTNGFVDSWMLIGPSGVLLTGCTAEITEREGQRVATETGATFVRRARWDDDMSPSKVE